MQKSIFSIKKLSYTIKGTKILNINNFDLHRGVMYLFTGFIGSGKSTLMQVLAKEKKIQNGNVLYENKNLENISKNKYSNDIVFLDQSNKRPWFGISVKNYMLKNIKNNGKQKNHAKSFDKICNSMKISNFILDKNIKVISEGEFRWIKLAICIALDSKVLIVDYIDKNLDYNKSTILNRVLKRKTSYDGVTIIASTYNPDFFKLSASVIIKMDKGRILQVRSSHKRPTSTKKTK